MKSALLSLIVIALLTTYYLLLTTYFASPVFAQSACVKLSPSSNYGEQAINSLNQCAIESDAFDDKIFNLNQIAGTTDSLYVLLTGNSQLHPETNQITANRGALASAGAMVAMLYSVPPASGAEYLAQKIQRLNPVQPAFAQQEGGIGFSALKPVQEVWSAFRNIAYVGFIIVFVIIGFMIMFRQKISSQAVATIQDSLPRIVIALILVTFSYAIAGLMIDAMFVILNVILQALKNANLINNTNVVFEKTIFSAGVAIFWPVFETVAKSIEGIISEIIKLKGLNFIVGWFLGGLAGVIAGVAVLIMIFRIFLMLLMSYVTVILLTIFAPFLFLWSSLPGQGGVKDWFKQVAANLAVFATVALMMVFAGILAGIPKLGSVSDKPKFKSSDVGHFPLLSGGLNPNDIGALIGIGFLFMTPSAAKIVKERIGVKEGALGAGMGAAMAGLGAGAVASRNIGKTAAITAGERFGPAQAIGDRFAAWREAPKIRRQAKLGEHAAAAGFEVPTYARSIPKKRGGG